LPITLDWRAAAIEPAFAAAWPELLHRVPDIAAIPASAIAPPACLSLYEAQTLEDEAQQGAQTIVNWLSAGKTKVAIVAQDRVVARRIRALLERARILVADETGWKLSTTRAAAALAAWFEVVAARGETIGLLDLLKSPFLFAESGDKSARVMAVEAALRRANVSGGWDAMDAALAELPAERAMLARIARDASAFAGGRRTLAEWVAATDAILDALEMRAALVADDAGAQVVALLEAIGRECRTLEPSFSFAEWRAFVNLRLESAPFAAPLLDDRVVMLPLNGAHIRAFDAVLLVGADADHLPSKPSETLFFANAVRRELRLATRESRQLQQLRDFTELLQTNDEVVLSWQANRNGEPNPVSPWIARLQLALERAGAGSLPMRPSCIPARSLVPVPVTKPAPSAPQLLPDKLSASGYNSLVACPYQFFATRMLRLNGFDELSDMPEKRDYGDWLHEILKIYHDTVRDRKVPLSDRERLLAQISEKIFERELARNAGALGYYARWKKAAPAYLAWANGREAQGWHFATGEEWVEKSLPLPQGHITLHGRIDRIDENDVGERAVLDYKTKTQQALNSKFKQLEDHQLPFYGLLSDPPASAAHYVALEPTRDKTGDAAAPNFAQWQQMLSDQIVRNMHAISQGAPLPASGIEAVCQYCEVRGLCRKGAWE
jgi:ATP-dependent helicase/nuclease subunit B